MKIKLLGIAFNPSQGITLSDLFAHINSVVEEPIEVGGYGRFLYIDEMDGYHVGLIITTKDHNKFLEFKRDKNSAKLEAKDVSDGAKLADFNFFAINKVTGRGIYQYYHQSCALNTFGLLCRKHYDNLKALRIDTARKQLPNLLAKDDKKILKQYAGTLQWEIIVRPENFTRLVSELSSIKAITLSLGTLTYKETVFFPLSIEAKSIRHRFNFTKETAVFGIVTSLLQLFNSTEIQNAKVEGLDSNGLEQIIKLVDTPDQFGEYDFDEIAETMTIVPSEFAEAAFLKEMIKVAKGALPLKALPK